MFSSQVGTIGTTWTFTKPQDFDPPQNILALPLLRYISESDGETVTRAYISDTHYSAVDPGAELPRRDDLEREALEHFTRHVSTRTAKRKSFKPEKVSFPHVDPGNLRVDRPYKVDTKKRVLVEMRKRKL